MLNFDHALWIQQFRLASKNKSGFRELRAEIWKQTVKIVLEGQYEVNGTTIKLPLTNLTDKTSFYTAPVSLFPTNKFHTIVSVIQGDCFEAAHVLLIGGLKPVVLNMADLYTPGGLVVQGSGAQEENLFRRSNLFQSLYQFVDFGNQYNVPRNPTQSYPMHPSTGAVYSPGVTVFRAAEAAGYALLQQPYTVDTISVAALDYPHLVNISGEFHLNTHDAETTKEKIRTIYRVSATHQNDSMVLSAFGCGAFCNPPKHIAELFKEVLHENEFNRVFKLVVFAIIDDHNAHREHNPQGNYLPFVEVFK